MGWMDDPSQSPFEPELEEQLVYTYSPCMRTRVVGTMQGRVAVFAAMQVPSQMERAQDMTCSAIPMWENCRESHAFLKMPWSTGYETCMTTGGLLHTSGHD